MNTMATAVGKKQDSQPELVEVKLIVNATVRRVQKKAGATIKVTPQRKAVMEQHKLIASTQGD